MGQDPFFVMKPRLRNKTYKNSLRDRDREIMDANFLYDTRLSHSFIYETRPRQDLTQNFRQDQDETRVLVSQDWDEHHLIMKKIIEYWLIFFLKS